MLTNITIRIPFPYQLYCLAPFIHNTNARDGPSGESFTWLRLSVCVNRRMNERDSFVASPLHLVLSSPTSNMLLAPRRIVETPFESNKQFICDLITLFNDCDETKVIFNSFYTKPRLNVCYCFRIDWILPEYNLEKHYSIRNFTENRFFLMNSLYFWCTLPMPKRLDRAVTLNCHELMNENVGIAKWKKRNREIQFFIHELHLQPKQ